jgi:hypothetical protein
VDPRAGLDDLEKRKFLTLPGLELYLFYVIIIYLTTLPVAEVTNGNIINVEGKGKRVERSGRGLI